MKHILNNISEEEKNAIREQHVGGMKVNTEKFKQLLETKQGDSKPLVSEQIQDRIVPSGPSPSAKPKIVKDKITSPSSMTKPTSPSPQSNNIVPCSKLGIKSLGSCDSKTKRPIDYCSALGIKMPGYCYIDTKQPMVENKLGNDKPLVDEQVLQGIKNFVNKGIDMVTGKTGNKFFDAVIGAELGKMKDGNSSNEKLFCMDDSCEVSLRVFSDGRVVYELAEFDTKNKGKMVLNSDGSFIIKFDDGSSSKKFMSK